MSSAGRTWTWPDTAKRTWKWADVQPHGTPAAYRRHLRHGTSACESCLQAERRRAADRRLARKTAAA